MQSLFDAASDGDAAQTKRLLKKGTPPDAMSPDGDTPLLCAAQGKDFSFIMQHLLYNTYMPLVRATYCLFRTT